MILTNMCNEKRARWKPVGLAIGMVLLVMLSACQVAESPSITPVKDIALGETEETSLSPMPPEASEPEEPTPESPEPTEELVPLPAPPEAELGVVGYIDIPNTKVRYPVVLYSDNEYYLNKDIDGKRDYKGAIFMDYRNAQPEERRNVILYGHNMKDQSMFSTLHFFEKEKFFKNNDELYFEMFGVKYRYEIVYTGVFDYRQYNHINTAFRTENQFLDYYREGAEYAQFMREGYEPWPGDQMLTLSTCVSHGVKDYNYKRMILVARMVAVVGVGEHTAPPESYGPAEAQLVLKEFPIERSESLQDYSEPVPVAAHEGGVVVIAPPGE